MSKKSSTDAEDILSELETEPTEKSSTEEPKITEEHKITEEPKITEDSDKTQETSSKYSETRSTIPVGKKPIMTYVNSTLTQLSSLPLVTITARGKSITAAVDVSQFILKRMNSVGYKIDDVRISSDLLESNDGKKRNVSSIEIDITKT